MKLIGMLDSPYVRRVAISLKMMGISFEHLPLSVFGDYCGFEAINPVVKAPTLVTANSVVLMDSTLILDYCERLVPEDRRLIPRLPDPFVRSQALLGLALAACEKTVQLVYEQQLRPPEKQHQPWIERVRTQLACAYARLEEEVEGRPDWLLADRPMQADITIAVAWTFTQSILVRSKARCIRAWPSSLLERKHWARSPPHRPDKDLELNRSRPQLSVAASLSRCACHRNGR
jgi:glutathione S-transferase